MNLIYRQNTSDNIIKNSPDKSPLDILFFIIDILLRSPEKFSNMNSRHSAGEPDWKPISLLLVIII